MRPMTRLAVAALTAAALACSRGAEAEQVQQALSTRAPVYLALGDSLAFGWHDGIAVPRNPHWFVGYASFLAELVELPLVNAACPSEASGSFLDPTQPDDGCRAFKADYPLHVAYDGPQMDYAAAFVATHPRLRLVTLQLGENDLQLLARGCAMDAACIAAQAQGQLAAVAGNVVAALAGLRAAGYTGQILVIDYYAPSTDPMIAMLVAALDDALAGAVAAARALLVDDRIALVDLLEPFAAEAAAVGGDPCATGLINRLPDGACEIHPSQEGYRFIAQLIAAQVEPRD